MAETTQFFANSAAYDRSMGRCSRAAGEKFLEWLALPAGLDWLDVGCGTGSFSGLVLNVCAPKTLSAIDPSEGQIAYAKSKTWADQVDFRVGDAMALPYEENSFDVAVMALVIQYIPDPEKAMREIVRVTKPGGTVATYTWPGSRDAHPMQPMADAMEALGISRRQRPGNQNRSLDALTALFEASGLTDVEDHPYEIQLSYNNFDDYWTSQTAIEIHEMTESEADRLKALLRERLLKGDNLQISYAARVNAIRGRLP